MEIINIFFAYVIILLLSSIVLREELGRELSEFAETAIKIGFQSGYRSATEDFSFRQQFVVRAPPEHGEGM
ncbi:MAG: hypothetical protein RLZZ104_1541 [Pseudomonadota bacterium]|jgi:hypothetical protein